MHYVLQVVRLSVWLALLTAIFAPLERFFALRPSSWRRPGLLVDLAYYFLSGLLPGIALTFPLAAVAWLAHRAVPWALLQLIAVQPEVVRIGLALLIGEVGFYWGHRWSHEIPFLWRFHAIHHSPEHMDFLVNTRAHPVDLLFTRLCGLVPLYILGLGSPIQRGGSLIPLLTVLIGTTWGFFIHANVKWRLGFVEALVATPAFHHWHHTNDGPELYNKNYAALLPWMDRIFGTLHLPRHEHPTRYGIDAPMPPQLLHQLVDPFLPADDVNGNVPSSDPAVMGVAAKPPLPEGYLSREKPLLDLLMQPENTEG